MHCAATAAGKTDNIVNYKGQDFYKLRAENARAGKLFEDPEFPAADSSLFFKQPPRAGIVWKRPGVPTLTTHYTCLCWKRALC